LQEEREMDPPFSLWEKVLRLLAGRMRVFCKKNILSPLRLLADSFPGEGDLKSFSSFAILYPEMLTCFAPHVVFCVLKNVFLAL
jgi:hypothetical protein